MAWPAFVPLANLPRRVIERFLHEEISIAMIARVFRANLLVRFFKTEFLRHFCYFVFTCSAAGASAGELWLFARKTFTAHPSTNSPSAIHSTNCSCLVKRCTPPIYNSDGLSTMGKAGLQAGREHRNF